VWSVTVNEHWTPAVVLWLSRVFMGVNPAAGNKAAASRKKSSAVPARVLKLVRAVANFEWLARCWLSHSQQWPPCAHYSGQHHLDFGYIFEVAYFDSLFFLNPNTSSVLTTLVRTLIVTTLIVRTYCHGVHKVGSVCHYIRNLFCHCQLCPWLTVDMPLLLCDMVTAKI